MQAQPRPALDNCYVAPRGIVEETILDIWEKILSVKGIGVNDDFFSLGGDSNAGVRMMADVCELYGVDISLEYALKQFTVSALAAGVEQELFQQVESLSSAEVTELLASLDVPPNTRNG